MYETIILDSKTIMVKSDNERALSEVIDFISKRDKQETIKAFLKFASDKRKLVKNYQFNREECYDHQNIHR